MEIRENTYKVAIVVPLVQVLFYPSAWFLSFNSRKAAVPILTLWFKALGHYSKMI